jgi:uncharacterized protein (TIGR00730 family)
MVERKIGTICVFCGSSEGVKPEYVERGVALGRMMAERDIQLIYGGGGIGVMGAVARGVIEKGGRVVGVIPYALASRERMNLDVEMRVVNTMHERKALMAEMSDAFVILPGGFGTFDEMFEIITWAQLGIHKKPIGLLNVAGYFDPLMSMIKHSIDEGFVSSRFLDLILVESSVELLLDKLPLHPETEGVIKWIDMEQV